MRFGILSQWFDPEPGPAALPGVLARSLVERGHDVQVLTGFPNYPTGIIPDTYRGRRRSDEVQEGVSIRRVALYASHDSSSLRRFSNYASFGLSATINGLRPLAGLDAIWVNYSPITVALPMWAARFLLRVPHVVHVLDLWPDTLLASGFARHGPLYAPPMRALQYWTNAMYRTASSVAYISPSVGGILHDRGVSRDKLHYVPMWADENIFRPTYQDLRRELGIPDSSVVLLYAGTLGEAQGLASLIDACSLVTDLSFTCIIAGSGVSESSLRTRAAEMGASNVRFLGRLPSEAMPKLMATSDMSYVSLREHPLSRATMPSKTQAALASAKAMLVAATGDVAHVAQQSQGGIVTEPENPTAIAASIRHAHSLGRDELRRMGQRARDYYETEFSVAAGTKRIESLLTMAAKRKVSS
ncbi:glycosyltransferase involved in cell wall biosynthesis [Georgenia soli]|uniref:D-inositol 3-phosphate glycosyltransferase n=1 Tax=Georgenia soli TaxID=638953 RepID=A0A2A9EJ98_9MICO|nr:glycosyltransferase family 4 protein [Georgenia soli]PFG39014.1 glycosyltransferase involved in cell wall biosynthesis [Georgenia soli]